MTVEQTNYKDCPVPENLSFDEASLFWRLRLGEGIPNRKWHKPVDRQKTWEEIKVSLDQKVDCKRTSAVFQKVYPTKNFIRFWFSKVLKTLKIAFLIYD